MSQHENEWLNLKNILTKQPVLKYFDPKRETKVSADASRNGLGAVLLQKYDVVWAPVAYASRSMTETEERYAQIEKEALAPAFACVRFHDYVYGLSFVLETDHKPLITISKKNLSDMTPRIQRLMMKLQRYDYNMIYTPGKQLLMADALSRATGQTKHPVSSSETEVSVHVDLVLSQIPASDEQLTKIAAETSQDPMLNKVIRCLDNEWPKNICKQYYLPIPRRTICCQ